MDFLRLCVQYFFLIQCNGFVKVSFSLNHQKRSEDIQRMFDINYIIYILLYLILLTIEVCCQYDHTIFEFA